MSFSVLRSPLATSTRALSSRLTHFTNARTFSVTANALKTSGSLPTFQPTSNSELDKLLSTIRNELFIPSHLSKRYHSLMHRKKNQHVLEEEPLVIEVGGQEVELTAKPYEVPIPVKLFTKALGLMQTPEDLDAIPGLIQGFTQANRRIRESQFEKMARVINMNGRVDLLMAIAYDAGKNGFKFTRGVSREFMRGIKTQNMVSDEKVSKTALKNAETLLNILGEPLMKLNPNERLKRDPVVVGVVLSMFASAAKRFNDGKDYQGLTQHYTQRLRNVWESVEWDQGLDVEGKRSVYRAKYAVLDYMPVLEGLVLARDILQGSELSPWLESESAKLNEAIGKWKQLLDKHSDVKMLGMHSYREVAAKLATELSAKRSKTKTKEFEVEESEEKGKDV